METIKFNNYQNLLENLLNEIENGSTLLTFSSRAARRFIFFYRKNKISKSQKVWRSPSVFTLKFFADLLFEEIITEKRVMSYEDSLLLFYFAVKSNHERDENFSFVDCALEYLRHYNFAINNKIGFSKEEDENFYLRNKIFEEFEKIRKERNFVSYFEEIEEIKKAFSQKQISLPPKIAILDIDEFSPLERDFIDFLDKNVSLCEFKIDESNAKLENNICLYEDIDKEVEATINRAIELWEKKERSIAICYFDDTYKKEIESILLNFPNSSENSNRYHFEDFRKISEFSSLDIIRKLLLLSFGQIEQNLLSIVSNPCFEPKIPLKVFNSIFFDKKKNKEEKLSQFKKFYRFADELDFLLKDKEIKVNEITYTVRNIITSHFNSQDEAHFKEIVEFFDFFENTIPDYEMTLSEFEQIFSATVQNRTLNDDSSEFCGIQVINYKNCVYQNFKKLFIVGANLSVLPMPIQLYPLFYDKEKSNCEFFDIEKHFLREENFLKKVLSTNGEVFFSRAKGDKDKPFLPSPFLKGKEVEEEWNKYNFEINKFYLPNYLLSAVKGEEKEYKSEDIEGLEIPQEMNVSQDITNLMSCPFLFFVKKYLKVEEPEMPSLLLDKKEFGSFLHQLLSKIGTEIKDKEDISDDEIKQTALTFFEETKKTLCDLEIDSLYSFLFGKEKRKGFLEKLIQFEKDRVDNKWQIYLIEQRFEKQFEEFDNAKIVGKVDRVEINRDSKKARIFDFKARTSVSNYKDYVQLDFYKKMVNFEDVEIQSVTTFVVKLLSDLKPQDNKKKPSDQLFQRTIYSFQKIKSGEIVADPYPNNSSTPCRTCKFELVCHIDKLQLSSNEDNEDEESENEQPSR